MEKNNMFCNLVAIFCMLFILSACSTKEENPYYLGDIAEVSVKVYKAEEKFGEIVPGKLEDMTKIELNEEGFPLKITTYDNDGDLLTVEKRKYEEERLISVVRYNSDGEEEFIQKIEYDGKLAKKQTVKCKYFNRMYEFENNGDYITAGKVYNNDTLESTFIQTKEAKIYTNEYKYVNDKKTKKTIREYDEKDRFVKYSDEDGKTSEIEYDNNGLIVKIKNGYISEYSHSDCTDITIMYGDDTIFCEYEFDDNGNWIKRIDYISEKEIKKPVWVYERVITYEKS